MLGRQRGLGQVHIASPISNNGLKYITFRRFKGTCSHCASSRVNYAKGNHSHSLHRSECTGGTGGIDI